VIFEQLKAGIERILVPPVARPPAITAATNVIGEEVAVEEAPEERRKRA
jgi:hypothetical protein